MIQVLRRLKWFLTYAGTTFYCPLCERSARKFIPNTKCTPGQGTIDQYQIVSMGARPNYACPWCFSSDKERLVWWYLSSILKPGLTILHVAPERNTRRRISAMSGIEYVCGDKFYDNDRYNDGRYDGVDQIDITALPYPDESFDLIICNHVLEHVEQDAQALAELYRVLRSGGKAILQVPISYATPTIEDSAVKTEAEREQRFGQIDHVRIYGIDYPEKLVQVGFSLTDIRAAEHPELTRLGINPREHLYVASRPAL